MASVNKAWVVGYATEKPELRHLPSGSPVVNLRLPTSVDVPGADASTKKTLTEWHRITLLNKLAEVAAAKITKGTVVSVMGRLQTKKYGSGDNPRYSTEIIADDLQVFPAGTQIPGEE